MINLAPVLFENMIWLSPSWIKPSAAKAFPASVTKKIVMSRKMRWQSLSHLHFFPFCTIGISMYQKRILPYFIIPSTFSPQASSPLEHSGQRNFNTPFTLTSFFFHWARGALPAGATLLGWPNYGVMADWTSCVERLNATIMLGLYNILDRYSRYLRTSMYVRK